MKKYIYLILVLISINLCLALDICEANSRDIKIISVNDVLLNNNKEWVWGNNEEVELEVRLWNQNEYSSKYTVELIFTKDEEIINITKRASDLKKEMSLNSNERKTQSFIFTIKDTIDFTNYGMYVKVYSKDIEECTFKKIDITVKKFSICLEENLEKLDILGISDSLSWNWKILDDINVFVKLKSQTDDFYDIELHLLDENGNDINFTRDSVKKEVYLVKDNTEDVRFNFTLGNELNEGIYELYARVYSQNKCKSLKAKKKNDYIYVNIDKSDNNIIIKKVYGPTSTTNGSRLEYIVNVVNQGRNQEKVKIVAYNYLLGLKESQEILNMSSGEQQNLSFTIDIPENFTIQRVKLEFSSEFDYKNTKYNKYSEEDYYHYLNIQKNSEYKNNSNGGDLEIIDKEEVSGLPNNTISEDVFNYNESGTLRKIYHVLLYVSIILSSLVAIYFLVRIIFFKGKKKIKYIPHEPRISKVYKAKLR